MIPNTGQTAPASGWRAWLPGITTFSTVVFMISGYFWLSASNRRCFVADQQISSLTNRFSRLEQDWENANLLSRGRITTTVLTCVPMAMPSNGAPLVVFTLKMINSGWPNSATDWKLRTRLPGGQILESLAGIAAGQASVGGIGFGQQFSTPFGTVSNMPPERNLVTMFELNSATIQVGTITAGWIAFQVKGIAINQIEAGTKFEISFRDALGRTNFIEHPYDAPFGQP